MSVLDRRETAVGVADETRLLAVVMGLPLVDGVFPALILSGALDSYAGVFHVGVLVFGGAATATVVLVEMDDDATRSVLAVTALLALGAGTEAALAPSIASMLDVAVFERFAALVLLVVAVKTVRPDVPAPRPAVVVALGLVASLHPAGFELVVVFDAALVAKAAGAAVVGGVFALVLVGARSLVGGSIDARVLRVGGGAALAVLALSVVGVAPEGTAVGVAVASGAAALR